VKKLLLLAVATLVMAACSEAPSSPTGPRLSPRNAANHDEIPCASGYIIAYDEEGNPYCKPDDTEALVVGGGTSLVNLPLAVLPPVVDLPPVVVLPPVLVP
jgi:hypothetical protein